VRGVPWARGGPGVVTQAELVGLVRAPCSRVPGRSKTFRKWSESEYQFGTTSMSTGCLNVLFGYQPCRKITELDQFNLPTK